MRYVRTSLSVAVLVATLAGLQPPAQAGTWRPTVAQVESEAKRFANISRTQRGYPPLRWNADLRTVARRHSAWMARNDVLRHNYRLRYQVMRFSRLGENVGVGPTMRAIHRALMNSPGHRRNLLGPYKLAGFGAAVTPDEIYITQVFLTPR